MRYSIATLLMLTAVFAVHFTLYLANNPHRPFHPRAISVRTTADENGIAMIHTAVRHHKTDPQKDVVEFIVLERFSVPQGFQTRVHQSTSSASFDRSVVLELPDRVVELPSDHQLLQLLDGEFTSLEGMVDIGCLTEFLKTFSSKSSIQELAELAEKRQQAEPLLTEQRPNTHR